MGGGGGGACIIQSVTDRGPNVVNGYKLFIKTLDLKIRPAFPDLHNDSATEPLCIPHARFPKQSDIYFKTLFFLSVPFCIYHRRFTAGIKGFSTLTGNVHARHLSLRLLSSRPTQFPCTQCKKFCQFHQVSRSSPICSVSVLCHSVHIHSSNAHTLAAQHCMQAYSAPGWQLQ